MSPKLNVQIDASAPFDAGQAKHNLVIDAQASNRGYTVSKWVFKAILIGFDCKEYHSVYHANLNGISWQFVIGLGMKNISLYYANLNRFSR